eukprot:4133505-Pyramimonas_sp.AAC.3
MRLRRRSVTTVALLFRASVHNYMLGRVPTRQRRVPVCQTYTTPLINYSLLPSQLRTNVAFPVRCSSPNIILRSAAV